MATGDKIYLRIVTRAHALSTNEPRTKPVFNIWDFKRTTTTGSPSKTSAYNAFLAGIIPSFKACLSVSYVTDFADYRWLDDPLDPFSTTSLSANGTVSGDSVPSLNNVFVKLGSGMRGGFFRGSKHVGPIAESSTTLDELNAGAVTLFTTFAGAWLTGFTAGDGFIYLPCIVSQTNSKFTSRVADVSAVLATTVTTNPILGKMNRRAQFSRSKV